MIYNCGSCNERLDEFKIHRRRQFNFGRLWFVLRHSRAVQCSHCLRYNFLLNKDDLARLEDSLIPELADWPEIFSGVQFSWIIGYLIKRAPKNELLALWLDWDGFSKPGKTDPKEEIMSCLARRIGCKSVVSLGKMEEAESISKTADEVLRSIMKMVFAPNGFPVKTEFDKENGTYVLSVNLAALTRKQGRKDDDLELRSRWQKVNKLLEELKQPILPLETFRFFVKDSKGEVFCCYNRGQREALMMVFAYFHQEDKFVYANRFAVKVSAKANKELLSALFLRLVTYAREKRAARVILERPFQEEVYLEAKRIGFKDKSRKLLEFPLIYVS